MQDDLSKKTLARTVDRANSKVFFKKRESNPLSDNESKEISYKNPELLRQFISEGARILPRRITNVTAKDQRKIKRAIKLARILGILPFIHDTSNSKGTLWS